VEVSCEKTIATTITSEAQLQNREVLWESSVDQTDEPMNTNVIGGADGGRAGQGSRSPLGQTESVNGAVVSGKGNGLSREASMGCPSEVQSPRFRAVVPATTRWPDAPPTVGQLPPESGSPDLHRQEERL